MFRADAPSPFIGEVLSVAVSLVSVGFVLFRCSLLGFSPFLVINS